VASAFALLSAFLWGTSDFLGGRASARVPATVVVFGAAGVSAVLALAGAVLLDADVGRAAALAWGSVGGIGTAAGGTALFRGLAAGRSSVVAPTSAVLALAGAVLLDADVGRAAALAWGSVGGIGTAAGGTALFRGLAAGRSSVVAPTSAVLAAALPLVVGVARGENPSLPGWLGICLALAAILLLSGSEPTPGAVTSGVGFGVVAGLGFGFHFIALDAAPDGSGLWPLAAAKAFSVIVVGAIILSRGSSLGRVGPVWRLVVAVGIVDMAAASSYLAATRLGMLSLSAVLTSLYPAPTVALSAVVNGERLLARHWAGGALALAAMVLIVA
jgi:drug/metabolite transporter (DMT)-like permease